MRNHWDVRPCALRIAKQDGEISLGSGVRVGEERHGGIETTCHGAVASDSHTRNGGGVLTGALAAGLHSYMEVLGLF